MLSTFGSGGRVEVFYNPGLWTSLLACCLNSDLKILLGSPV